MSDVRRINYGARQEALRSVQALVHWALMTSNPKGRGKVPSQRGLGQGGNDIVRWAVCFMRY